MRYIYIINCAWILQNTTVNNRNKGKIIDYPQDSFCRRRYCPIEEGWTITFLACAGLARWRSRSAIRSSFRFKTLPSTDRFSDKEIIVSFLRPKWPECFASTVSIPFNRMEFFLDPKPHLPPPSPSPPSNFISFVRINVSRVERNARKKLVITYKMRKVFRAI